jgi:PAS domain S-box-containing protein
MGLTVFIILLMASSVAAGFLTIFTWRKRKVLGTAALPGLLMSIAIWTLAASLELAATTLEGKQLLTILCYVGIFPIPVFFFLFAVEYTNIKLPFKQFVRIAIWVIPLVSFVVLVTNKQHGLFYLHSELKYNGTLAYNSLTYGSWWWVHLAYSYILICIAVILFIQMRMSVGLDQKKQALIILGASVIPFIGNMLYISGVKPYGFIDLTPIAFASTGFLFAWGISQNNLFNYKPIALQTLFESIPDGIIVLDKEGIPIQMNVVAKHILNSTDENIDIDAINRVIIEPLGITTKSSLDVFTKINNGTYNIIVNPLQVDNKEIVGKLILLRNVSESLKTQKELSTAQNRLELAAKVAGLDPWENNLKTGQAIGGEQIYFELGYSPQEIPRTMEEIFTKIHPDDLQLVKRKLLDHLSGKTNFYTTDFRMRNKWGEYRWVANFGMVTERDEEGKAVNLVGLTMNINERKKAEEKIKKQNEELIKTNAEKDKFFSILAHDLRSPFQGFISLTELMAEKSNEMEPDELASATKTLQDTVKNIYELLENLLSWAMIKRGTKKFNPEKLRLAPLVKSTIDLLSAQIVSKEHTVKNQINSDVEVFADRESIKTILRNLLSNAIKFTPKGGSVEILLKPSEKGFLTMGITDNGIGMPEEILANLFNIQSKVSRPGTDNEPSTGLGLILCKELIEKHGGKLWAESEVGKGTSFWLSLPSAS